MCLWQDNGTRQRGGSKDQQGEKGETRIDLEKTGFGGNLGVLAVIGHNINLSFIVLHEIAGETGAETPPKATWNNF